MRFNLESLTCIPSGQVADITSGIGSPARCVRGFAGLPLTSVGPFSSGRANVIRDTEVVNRKPAGRRLGNRLEARKQEVNETPPDSCHSCALTSLGAALFLDFLSMPFPRLLNWSVS